MVERDNEEQLNPRLVELLDQLRPTPPRNPELVKRGQERFLAEVDSLALPTPSRSPLNSLARQLDSLLNHHNNREDIDLITPKSRFAFTTIAVLLVFLAFLFGGSAVTALAAQSALPGDALYSVKTTLEQTRLSLARDAADRAQLQLEFAELRLGEIEALIAEGRYQNISTATLEFITHIHNALAEFETISKGDPDRAAELMLKITEALTRYAQSLNNMLANVPEPVQAEMQRAIQAIHGVSGREDPASEIEFSGIVESMGAETWLIAGRSVRVTSQTEIKGAIAVGNTVKVHAVLGDGDELTAREIELLAAGEDKANTNTKANENANENANVNENANGNDNSNANTNEDFQEKENRNTNDNANDNANESRHDDRNTTSGVTGSGSANDNKNSNTNDGDSNDDGEKGGGQNGNDNDNSNHNDNDNDNDNYNDNDNRNRNDNNGRGNDNDD